MTGAATGTRRGNKGTTKRVFVGPCRDPSRGIVSGLVNAWYATTETMHMAEADFVIMGRCTHTYMHEWCLVYIFSQSNAKHDSHGCLFRFLRRRSQSAPERFGHSATLSYGSSGKALQNRTCTDLHGTLCDLC